MCEHLDVEIGQWYHGADVVRVAQLPQRRHVRRVVDPGYGLAVVGGVLRRRQRVGVSGNHGRVLGERRDDVVALAHPGEQDAYVALGGCHPPLSPL